MFVVIAQSSSMAGSNLYISDYQTGASYSQKTRPILRAGYSPHNFPIKPAPYQ
jgi:hypothetical protein